MSNHKSRWLCDDDDRASTNLSPEVWAFEQWLIAHHYEPAVEVCPRNDGEFFGAVDACDVLDSYWAELESDDPGVYDALMAYAAELGEIADGT
jgi:hypothetical protein